MMDFRLNKNKYDFGENSQNLSSQLTYERMVIIVHTLNMWCILSRRKSSYLSIPEK